MRRIPSAILICVAATGVIIAAFTRIVDLEPEVDTNFFFAAKDPQLRVDNAIDRTFPATDPIIIAATGDIESASYNERIRLLSDELAAVRGVTAVQSLSRGPKDLDDAIRSPLWSRLLIAPDHHSTYVYVTMRQPPSDSAIERIQQVGQRQDRAGFHIVISGVPYVTRLIAKNLAQDLRVFTLAAVAVFGVMLLLIFRSAWVLAGTFLSCATSGAATLIVTTLVRLPIGPLTANLSTIVFVMTLSPIVFLTFNYRRIVTDGKQSGAAARQEAIRRTITPSFWSATCMFLGFISLLFVSSTPMRHLGISGAIGATMAFVAAYAIYPWFLERAGVRSGSRHPSEWADRLRAFFGKRHGSAVAAVAVFSLVGGYGLLRLDTDPGLSTYFKRGGEIRTGLDFIDRGSGSSPLKLVVEDRNHARLDTHDAYHRLLALHQALERDPAVGAVVSIAIILGEAKRPWLSNFVSTEHLVNILDEPKYGSVARQFIDPGRERALLLLRMREIGRSGSRDGVMSRLRATVERHGFRTAEVGGTYELLGQMSKLLTSSIITGVLMLLAIFAGMGLMLSRSPRVAGAMLLSLAVIPVVVRGYIAWLGMPLDFITASAANIDIGMGVDAMIYVTMAARRAGQGRVDRWAAWSKTCAELWQPVGTSLLIVCSGFGIFLLSNFPPTQRFGLFVIFGSITAAAIALLVFPWLAAPDTR